VALTFYCEDGHAEISNVLAENALRCVALGRRNYMFVGSDSGGERAAAMYSLIGSCLCRIRHRAEDFLVSDRGRGGITEPIAISPRSVTKKPFVLSRSAGGDRYGR
jgi:hypothetical protein